MLGREADVRPAPAGQCRATVRAERPAERLGDGRRWRGIRARPRRRPSRAGCSRLEGDQALGQSAPDGLERARSGGRSGSAPARQGAAPARASLRPAPTQARGPTASCPRAAAAARLGRNDRGPCRPGCRRIRPMTSKRPRVGSRPCIAGRPSDAAARSTRRRRRRRRPAGATATTTDVGSAERQRCPALRRDAAVTRPDVAGASRSDGAAGERRRPGPRPSPTHEGGRQQQVERRRRGVGRPMSLEEQRDRGGRRVVRRAPRASRAPPARRQRVTGWTARWRGGAPLEAPRARIVHHRRPPGRGGCGR